tara:strand:+ start:426 stop:671 length:246 start_codon:yes stop_codon:yes gene_type:complete
MNEDTTEVALLKKNVQELQEQLSKANVRIKILRDEIFSMRKKTRRERKMSFNDIKPESAFGHRVVSENPDAPHLQEEKEDE